MRLNDTGSPVLGVWESAERRIVIRRDQLSGIASYAGTLLDEIGHMVSGTSDGTLDIEQVLPSCLAGWQQRSWGDRDHGRPLTVAFRDITREEVFAAIAEHDRLRRR
jgi:hypothetical protein